jgi:hypothetical protein
MFTSILYLCIFAFASLQSLEWLFCMSIGILFWYHSFFADFAYFCFAGVECKDKSGRFAELVPTEVNNARSGGKRKSKNAETWAANAFDEWRRCHGYSTAKSIADLSKEDDLHVFVDMLFKFTLQVRKLDGGLYPPTS